MAIIDVVKFDGDPAQLAWKFPSENLRLGTQLVVKTAQVAFFVKSGQVFDKFGPGTYTLKTSNIPLLGGLIRLPFGGDTPFQAEVWFVNLLTKLDASWGTATPLQVEDPRYGIVVPLRAFGQFGYQVSNPLLLLQKLIGVQDVFSHGKIEEYFKGILLQSMSSNIVKALVRENIGVLQLTAFLSELSGFCKTQASVDFDSCGLELLNFYFISINIPENDPSYLRLKEIKEKSAELNIIGKDIYQFDKSMDVLKTAAGNEGSGSSIMQTGLGLGMGLNLGNQIGQQFGNMVTQVPNAQQTSPPPLSNARVEYFVAIDGRQAGPFDIDSLRTMSANGTFKRDNLVWKQGMTSWQSASEVNELNGIFNSNMPPPIPT